MVRCPIPLIGNGVKLDNQIMIAHNVQIGDNTAMAGCCGISGSTKIGKNCMIAGGVGMVGHIEVCDNVFVTGMTMVTRSITEPGAYSSGTAMQPAGEWRRARPVFVNWTTWPSACVSWKSSWPP